MTYDSSLKKIFYELMQLTRLNKPVGSILLLWPTLWALWLAAKEAPSWHNLLVFFCGVFLMRSAGCVINDYADRHIDGKVARTAHRPLTKGLLSNKIVFYTFILLVFVAFLLVLTTNLLTIYLSFIGLLLACIYPFSKRYIYLPQFILGAAFGFSVPMAFAAEAHALPLQCWLLFAANLLWVVAYDTQYAMVDREDDIKIGVKSTAILFAQWDILIIGLLQFSTILILIFIGTYMQLHFYFYSALLLTAALFIYQTCLLRSRCPEKYFKAFKNNQWVGAIILLGIILSL